MCTKDSLIIKLYNIEVLKVVGLKSFYPWNIIVYIHMYIIILVYIIEVF